MLSTAPTIISGRRPVSPAPDVLRAGAAPCQTGGESAWRLADHTLRPGPAPAIIEKLPHRLPMQRSSTATGLPSSDPFCGLRVHRRTLGHSSLTCLEGKATNLWLLASWLRLATARPVELASATPIGP
jgi:hypothetical protein